MPGNTSTPPELARRAAMGDFSPDVLAWLGEGLRRHVIDGVSTDVALRLNRAARRSVRNEALCHAAALLRLGDDAAWTVAGRLLQAVVRHHRLADPPATPVEVAIAGAFVAGTGMPDSQQGLYNIIIIGWADHPPPIKTHETLELCEFNEASQPPGETKCTDSTLAT